MAWFYKVLKFSTFTEATDIMTYTVIGRDLIEFSELGLQR